MTTDSSPEGPDHLLAEILDGLSAETRTLPAKLFYDQTGSQLFDSITGLDAYYPTRCEIRIMESDGAEMAEACGPRSLLFELGSGSSLKTRFLLDSLCKAGSTPAAYVPIDISAEHLEESARNLRERYPDIPVLPIAVDYTTSFSLPEPPTPAARRVAYYPGSTIGNFHPEPACNFLRLIASLAGKGGGLLIGVDLRKDTHVLETAYNDPEGVTAAFNLNMLHRLNREFGANFDHDRYRHLAFYDEQAGRIEMHIESLVDQTVTIAGHDFRFRPGETVRTECSYKYTLDGFRALAEEAGWRVRKVWTDTSGWFSVQYLETDG